MKRCTKCGTEKPESEFYKSKDGRDGLLASCKICTRERIAEYCRQHKEEAHEWKRKASKKYYLAHPLQVAERAKRYRRTNAGKTNHARQARKYYRAHKEVIRERRREGNRRYRIVNHKRSIEVRREYYRTHKKQINAKTLKWQNKETARLGKSYVIKMIRQTTGLASDRIPPEMIGIWREHLLLSREIKSLEEVAKCKPQPRERA